MRRVVIASLAMMSSSAAGQTIPPAPSGWSVATANGGHVYTSSSGSGQITFLSVADIGEMQLEVAARTVLNRFSQAGCASAERTTAETLFAGRGTRLKTVSPRIDCSTIALRKDGKIFMIVALARPGAADVDVALRVIAGSIMQEPAGRTAPSVAQPSAPPRNPAAKPGDVRVSVPSSGTVGIWVALTNRTVYDPVLTVRMEMGLDYLILTKGNYFMTELPRSAGLDDDAARRMAEEDPDTAGRFRVEGNGVILQFASGKVKRAEAIGVGTARHYRIEGDDYQPKRSFPDGTVLNGTYSNTAITRASSDVFVTGDKDLTFAANGRFARGGQVAVTGSAFASIGADRSSGGRYEIRSGAVHMSYDDGRRESLSIWQEDAGAEIWFGGDMYKRQGRN